MDNFVHVCQEVYNKIVRIRISYPYPSKSLKTSGDSVLVYQFIVTVESKGRHTFEIVHGYKLSNIMFDQNHILATCTSWLVFVQVTWKPPPHHSLAATRSRARIP